MTTEMEVKTKIYKPDFFEKIDDCSDDCYVELKNLKID
jgi:hypothetical protein